MSVRDTAFCGNGAAPPGSNPIASSTSGFICGCADPACSERITLSPEEYEEVRTGAARFIVASGHEYPSIERVVEVHGEYEVVEKFGERVRAIVRRLNPRAEPI